MERKDITIAGKRYTLPTTYTQEEIAVIESIIEEKFHKVSPTGNSNEYILRLLCLELAESTMKANKAARVSQEEARSAKEKLATLEKMVDNTNTLVEQSHCSVRQDDT